MAASAPAQFSKPSAAQQLQLGKQAARELRSKERVLPAGDPRVEVVRRVGRRLLAAMADRTSPWEYSFDVIDSNQINAFALPGGPTFVYTGLLSHLKSEDELAGVMGHELTHVRKEHWAYAYRDQQRNNALLTLGALVFRPSRGVLDAAGLGSTLLLDLPFSRRHETEADQGGMDLMVRAGYNPQGMVDVFQMLNETSKGGRPPEFLSDHPSDSKRIRRMQEQANSMNRNFAPQRPLYFRNGG
ncbi:peptidase M48, Ste24p [Fimbriimonas ginsengisoli Gsoil 348]|uniref:Peptidase M48, Ste24p n=1 Tax=Fimbriimonas ginsengisoli Gsoil 348 TaxID=661478 RepID=A0A068NJE4_FIMGI|nr:peptidase M48, Ste24p [Fimbriimonas ginsengisoli Gsoil 348]